ncbi:PTS system ascorbate-specific IIA component [Natronocella acetinitrilica]|uniref:PTS system ascorbate-specific IIA component n=1 Tax=Natronocella acetinitrilica TaxID=414046 RepID=A0AAE3KFC3_9GAMM|nr:PTS sugar transporter subunit IIA [Natronocella acetinitrilica]MCP1673897.1 PTS system ascorbate-specific IIA component [Natronocella acetinitrilica]
MSVGILLVTHNAIGQQLLETAKSTLGFCPVQTGSLAVTQDVDPDGVERNAVQMLETLDTGDGVLVLTDAYGSTPSNVACRLARRERICVIAGVNLPMLLRVFNYPRLSLHELAEKALTGGQDGVVMVQTNE